MDELTSFVYENEDGETEGFIESPSGISVLSLVNLLDKLSNRLPNRSMLFDSVDPCVLEIDDEGALARHYEIGDKFETIQELIAHICVNPGMLSYQRFGVIAPGKGMNMGMGEMRTIYVCLLSDGPGSVEVVVWDNNERVLLMKPYKLTRSNGTLGDAVLLLSNKLAFDLLPQTIKTRELVDMVDKNIQTGFALLTGKDDS